MDKFIIELLCFINATVITMESLGRFWHSWTNTIRAIPYGRLGPWVLITRLKTFKVVENWKSWTISNSRKISKYFNLIGSVVYVIICYNRTNEQTYNQTLFNFYSCLQTDKADLLGAALTKMALLRQNIILRDTHKKFEGGGGQRKLIIFKKA